MLGADAQVQDARAAQPRGRGNHGVEEGAGVIAVVHSTYLSAEPRGENSGHRKPGEGERVINALPARPKAIHHAGGHDRDGATVAQAEREQAARQEHPAGQVAGTARGAERTRSPEYVVSTHDEEQQAESVAAKSDFEGAGMAEAVGKPAEAETPRGSGAGVEGDEKRGVGRGEVEHFCRDGSRIGDNHEPREGPGDEDGENEPEIRGREHLAGGEGRASGEGRAGGERSAGAALGRRT